MLGSKVDTTAKTKNGDFLDGVCSTSIDSACAMNRERGFGCPTKPAVHDYMTGKPARGNKQGATTYLRWASQ